MVGSPSTVKEAHALLQRIAASLENPSSRANALQELHALAERSQGAEGGPLRLQTVELSVGTRQERLRLFLLPSIFAPEDWAYTFLEGLLRTSPEELEGRSLVEVGTGSGWIPVVLAKLTRLQSIHGVDLNPHARAVATCNLWLNCSEEEAGRVSLSQGDLLRDLPEGERWDFVVGCIPQVLRSEGWDTAALEQADEEALYDLSNYCAIQNVYEDHFGLGLIARLLDEVPERMRPGGRVVLNLAGRPGRAIIERMFARRGFASSVVVARRVRQAADTDIRPLVDLERRTRSEFEFFLTQHSPEPIRAQTALGWLAHGQPIWHEVAVWEAALVHPHEVLALRRGLREVGAERLLGDLDLGRASQEQLAFVASLAERLSSSPFVPYAQEAGDPSFRRLVSRYLSRFFDLHLGEDEIFVAPEREQAVHSLLLATCDPGDRVLVTRNVHATYEGALEKAGVEVTVTNDTLREVSRLLGAFDPKVVLLAVSPQERTNLAALLEIVDEAARRGIRVVIDESAYFNITSGVEPRTLFELLAKETHRPNLVVLYGMIKNAVYPDYELTLLLPVEERLFSDLEIAAEVTYSRVSTLVQWFYEDLFAALLSFQISFAPPGHPGARRRAVHPLQRSERIEAIARAPAFAPRIFDPSDPRLIRLDYGENEDRIPSPMVEGLLAASSAPKDSEPIHGLEEAIAGFLLETRSVAFQQEEIVTAQGVWPLIHDAAAALGRKLGRAPKVFVAAPCYGLLPPTLLAAGCEVEEGPLSALERGGLRPDAVVISQPANPRGCFLGEEELRRLVRFCEAHGARIFSDEIFGLLSLEDPSASEVPSPISLFPEIADRVVIFGGLSKELAAGGLRVGWAATKDRELLAGIRKLGLAPLQLTAARTASHLYGSWARNREGELLHPERRDLLDSYMREVRERLRRRRELLAPCFPEEDCSPAGLFLAPRIEGWLGKEIGGERITPENLPAILYRETGVVVNGGPWCSDRERIRTVFSIPEAKVEEAARRLRAFAASLGE